MILRAPSIGFVLLGVALLAALTALAPRGRVDWNAASGAALTQRAAELVDRLPDDVRITHYVTSREDLPGTYDALPLAVEESLGELFASSSRVELHSADPDAHPDWSSFLSAAGVRPWRARTVERDGWTEQRLWSSLRIECGPSPAAVWNGIGPDDLPLFAPWVLGRLEQLVEPRRILIGLAAPPEYGVLRARLAALGKVVEVDMRDAQIVNAPLDVLLWIDPGAVSAEQLARFDDLLAAGCSAVVAGSAWTATDGVRDGLPTLALERTGFAVESFFAHFGLDADPLPLFDARSATAPGPDGEPIARPHRVRCIAPNQDFRELVGQPNGDLPFDAATTFRIDTAALESREMRATVIATADDTAYHPPLDEGELTLADWNALPARDDARAPLAAYLRSADPWSGELLLFGASTPFADSALESASAAPSALLRVIADTLGSDERLVRRTLAERRPAPLPELAPRARLAWRSVCVLAIPLALAVATWLLRRGRASGTRAWKPWIPVAAGLIGTALIIPLLRAGGVTLSASITTDDEVVRTLTRLLPTNAPISRLYTVFSFPSDLPPELRGPAREASERCKAFAAAIPGLEHETLLVAEGASPPESLRVEPLAIRSSLDERTIMRRVYSHVVLDAGAQTFSFALDSPAAFDELPFRLALSFDRAQRGAARKLAVVANPPRLSPAEVELQYNRRGLHAPRGGESYAGSLNALREAGFEVLMLDRSAPIDSTDADALLWLQPRRDTLPVAAALATHLANGGRALVAGQHHRVVAQQRDDARGELRFWPQPQFCDLDEFYLPELGVRLEREVLCDALHAALLVPTQITTAAGIELRLQSSAQPFFLRVPASNRAAGFGGSADWVLPNGNRWSIDAARLEERGLELRVLAETSTAPWTYAWEGGDLPPEVSTGERTADGALRVFQDRLPLAIELRGSFPRAQIVKERGPDGRERGRLDVATNAVGPPGRLILIGGSECFTDDYARAAGARMDRALLAAVSDLCLPDDIARLLPREPSATGFDYVPPRERLIWRGVVLGLVPALLIVLALLWRWRS